MNQIVPWSGAMQSWCAPPTAVWSPCPPACPQPQCLPPPQLPPPWSNPCALGQPILGVTNGAEAQPGFVGEYIHYENLNMAYPATPQVLNFTSGVLPPGDWDCWAFAGFNQEVTSLEISLTGQGTGQQFLPGFDSNMQTVIFLGGGSMGNLDVIFVNSQPARALTTVPTLIAWTMATNQNGTGANAGTLTFEFKARRRR